MDPMTILGLVQGGASLLGSLTGSNQQNQTTSSEPWKPTQGAILGALQGAQPLLGQPRQFYSGSTVAQQSPFAMAGIQGMANMAAGPNLSQMAGNASQGFWNPQNPMSMSQMQRGYGSVLAGGPSTMGGQQARSMLTQAGGPVQQIDTPERNPYLDKLFQQGANQIESRLGSQFASGGRLRSGAYQRAFGEQLGDAANQIYGSEATRQADRNLQARIANQQAALSGRGQSISAAGQLLGDEQSRTGNMMQALGQGGSMWNAGQARALQALGMAPQLQQAAYQPFERMISAGAMDRDYQQQLIDADVNRFNFYEGEPWQRIGDFLNLQGWGGGQGFGTQSTPMYRNRGAEAMMGISQMLPGLGNVFGGGGGAPAGGGQFTSMLNNPFAGMTPSFGGI